MAWCLTPPLRPAAIGGAGPPLPDLQGDAVGANAGREHGPHAAAEGDPRRQGGHHHHRRQRLHLLPDPPQGPVSAERESTAWVTLPNHHLAGKSVSVILRYKTEKKKLAVY